MPRTDDPTIYVPNPSVAFRSANPEVFAKAQGDPDTLRRLGAVETRAEAIKQRFYAHFERHQDVWVAAETDRLVKNRSYPVLQHPPPRGFHPPAGRGPDIAELMSTKARQNVHARAINRITAINTVKANLQNALIRNRPEQVQTMSRLPPDRTPANDARQKHGLRNNNA